MHKQSELSVLHFHYVLPPQVFHYKRTIPKNHQMVSERDDSSLDKLVLLWWWCLLLLDLNNTCITVGWIAITIMDLLLDSDGSLVGVCLVLKHCLRKSIIVLIWSRGEDGKLTES